MESAHKELVEAERLAVKLAMNFATMEIPSRQAERILHEQEDLVEGLKAQVAELQSTLRDYPWFSLQLVTLSVKSTRLQATLRSSTSSP